MWQIISGKYFVAVAVKVVNKSQTNQVTKPEFFMLTKEEIE